MKLTNSTKKGKIVSLALSKTLAEQYHRLDASFVPWSVDLRNHLLTRFPLLDGTEPMPESELLQPKWTLALQTKAEDLAAITFTNGDHGTADSMVDRMTVTLKENRRMTPDTHWQDVRHLAFASEEAAAYGPGDVLTIYPKNSPEDVDQLLTRMDWSDIADKPIHFTPTKPLDGSSFYPSPSIALPGTTTTLRTLLTQHLDLTTIPRRSFFSLIAHFTDDQFHKDRLLEFTQPEYIDELYDYTTRPRRSILEVLQEFESVRIPWQWAANVLPELRGRQFSIASGGRLKSSPQGTARFELLVAIVKYKTVIKKIREGVCTRYLANLPVRSELYVTLQKGGLAIGKGEARRPVMMVGPGTGVAPMRSMIWERLSWAQEMRAQIEAASALQPNGPPSIPQSLLFFGCRSQSADYFYEIEWDRIKDLLPFEIYPAFSRDQERKVYVQDLIREHADSVFHILHENNGIIYVCGSSGKMPQAVRAALVDVFIDHGKMEREMAEKLIKHMEREGRYKQETW